VAKHHVDKAMQFAYRDRRTKKRTFRQLWVARINAAARLNGTTYSRLIAGLNRKDVDINRKILADLAVSNPPAFAEVVKFALS
jgi:large subunit ribosomal protein L20